MAKAGALSGIRVLDLSRVLAAPLAAQWLADLGAEVIKVERPGVGDESRTYGPPFMTDADGRATETAAFYLACNRGKQSIAIDHSLPEGQALILRLVAQCDVLLENFRPGVLAKYGLDYESLKAVNPRLVYCSITGFGQDGPYRHKPGYDGIFQAMGGMMSVSGHPHEPMKVGVSMVDILTSLYGGMAILAALRHRDQISGEGQYIDLALLDCGLASLSHFAQNYLVSGEVPTRRGNGGFGGVPSQAFKCSDRSLFLVAGNNKQFAALCGVLGRPELAQDARFAKTASRISHRADLLAILDDCFATRPAQVWIAALELADVPASLINELPEVFADPQVRHRAMQTTVQHPLAGELKLLANPIRFSGTPVARFTAPPLLGEHTQAVLGSLLGLTPADYADLVARKVLA